MNTLKQLQEDLVRSELGEKHEKSEILEALTGSWQTSI